MITKEELERIKQGDGLTVESNGIRHYNASEVLINGHSLTEVLEAAAAYKEEQPKVLDADGVEIKPGETLYYRAESFTPGRKTAVVESVHIEKNPGGGNEPWVQFHSGWEYAHSLTHQKPDTLLDVIADLGKSMEEYWGCEGFLCANCPSIINGKNPHERYETDYECKDAMHKDVARRLEAIAKRMGGDGERKADSPVEIPERKTCPHCGRSHVITTKVITIGEGRYREAETVLCLTCGRDLPGDQ